MAGRFERFTDRARRVMQLAEHEARRGKWECVDTSHLLVGLLAEGNGVGAAALREHGLDLAEVRTVLSGLGLPQPPAEPELVTLGKLPLTPKVLAAIEAARRDAAALGHTYVGTEHLLLGLLAVNDATGCALLRSANVPPEAVCTTVLELLGRARPGAPRWTPEAPTQPAVYWWRPLPTMHPQIGRLVLVKGDYEDSDQLVFHTTNGHRAVAAHMRGEWWSEPVPVPPDSPAQEG